MSDAGKALFNTDIQVNPSSSANLLIDNSSDVMQLKAKKDGTDDVDLAFHTQASGGTLSEKMRILGDGKVGIGTSSPSRPIHAVMNGDAALFDRIGSAGGVMLFANGGTVKGNINVSSSGFGIGSLFSENDLFFPTSAQAHVGLGTTDFPTGMNSSSYAQFKVGGATLSDSGGGNGSATFLSNNAYVGSGNNMYLDGGGAASTIMQTQGALSVFTFDGSGGSADGSFSTSTPRMKILNTGVFLVAKSTDTFSASGLRVSTDGATTITRSGSEVLNLNRTTNDGAVVYISQDGLAEGTISVSGGTVTYGGFTGTHDSSGTGISSSIPIGTVLSTIDEEHKRNHAKVKVSDSIGDKRVYGVMQQYNDEEINDAGATLKEHAVVACVGIGSVRVTGACEGGDLLESNGDGTAKVQDDDIIKSKTIGKVTIGNSDTAEKLVSCVLYCG